MKAARVGMTGPMRGWRGRGAQIWLVLGLFIALDATASSRDRPAMRRLHVAVRDSTTGSPLRFAVVKLLGTKLGSMTDSLGHCTIEGPPPGMAVLRTGLGGLSRQDTIWVTGRMRDTVQVVLGPRPATWDSLAVPFGKPHRIDTRSRKVQRP